MTKRIGLISVVAYLVIFLPVAAFSKNSGTLDHFRKEVKLKRLSNGINVIMLNRGYSPTLALLISFSVGSSDESYRTIGAAHMLEHMLFKGTDRVGTRDFAKEKIILDKIEKTGETLDRLMKRDPSDKRIPKIKEKLHKLQKEHEKYVISSPYDRIYTSRGGVGYNAGTSRDKTTYIIELPSSELELWAKLESERLRNPVFREFYRERNTVMEERLMRYESRGFQKLMEHFIATAFIAHPYRHPVIGWASNIQNFSIQDMREFYTTHYIPSRMTITVIGKQDTGKTFEIIKRYFGRMKRKPPPPRTAIEEPYHRGERRFTIYFDSNPYIIMGWNKPTYPSRDDIVLDVISGILAEGKTSRLYKKLVLEKKIASSVNAWSSFPGSRYNNLFVITAVPKYPHSPGEIEKAVYDEIKVMSEGISRQELETYINKIEASLVFDLSSNRGIAQALDYYHTIFGDWGYLFRYMDEVKTVTENDVIKTMKKYFTVERRTVGILLKSTAHDTRKSGSPSQ